MADLDKLLEVLDQAHRRYEDTEAAHAKSHEAVVQAALDALRAGAEPGDVYARIPFTSTYMRTLARDAGIPAGRPGIKPATKTVTVGRHTRRSQKARQIEAENEATRQRQAAHDDGTSSPPT